MTAIATRCDSCGHVKPLVRQVPVPDWPIVGHICGSCFFDMNRDEPFHSFPLAEDQHHDRQHHDQTHSH